MGIEVLSSNKDFRPNTCSDSISKQGKLSNGQRSRYRGLSFVALPNLHKSPHTGLGLELSCSAFNFLAAGGMVAHPPAGGPWHLPDA
jgi:hypothetical protein